LYIYCTSSNFYHLLFWIKVPLTLFPHSFRLDFCRVCTQGMILPLHHSGKYFGIQKLEYSCLRLYKWICMKSKMDLEGTKFYFSIQMTFQRHLTIGFIHERWLGKLIPQQLHNYNFNWLYLKKKIQLKAKKKLVPSTSI
jgi:hypothetical protein